MRKFNSIIFLGSGHYSAACCYALHKRLEEGLIILGGLQQPDHPESEEHYKQCKIERKRFQIELDDIIDDICVALGRNI